MNKKNKTLNKFVSVLVISLGIYLFFTGSSFLIFERNNSEELIISLIQIIFGIFSLIWGIYYLRKIKNT